VSESAYVTCDAHGRMSAAAIEAALRPETRLVSVLLVNNETGVIQDLHGIVRICRLAGSWSRRMRPKRWATCRSTCRRWVWI
jgi:cysteine sulfinate desulfinase/cysteine desulfurase-like protein